MVPDFGTLRLASWLDKTAFVLCDVKSEKTHDYVDVAPRSILRRQIDAAKKAGYAGYAGTELEHYLFQTSYRQAAQQDYRNLEPAGWYLEDYHILQGTRTEGFHAAARRHLKLSGVPVENSKGEWGKGQHELNVRYAEALEMADRHVVFKQCLKEIAEAMGLSVTFMAKFAADGAGSSCHIHFSLWRDGKNAFAGTALGPMHLQALPRRLDRARARRDGVLRADRQLLQALRGRLVGADAPRVEQRQPHRRLPRRRRAARACASSAASPGADCNPYLALAASLASGLDGIANKIEPPECFVGDIYQAKTCRACRTRSPKRTKISHPALLQEGVRRRGGRALRHFYRTEAQAYDKAVTDWERRRYFERI